MSCRDSGFAQGCAGRLWQSKGLLRWMLMAMGPGVAGAAQPGKPNPSGHSQAPRERHRGGSDAPSQAKYRAAWTQEGAGILILFSRKSASPRGGGLGTNKKRWLSPSRREGIHHGVCFHLPARRPPCGGTRPALGLSCTSLTVAPRDGPGDKAPGHTLGAQRAPVMSCIKYLNAESGRAGRWLTDV